MSVDEGEKNDLDYVVSIFLEKIRLNEDDLPDSRDIKEIVKLMLKKGIVLI